SVMALLDLGEMPLIIERFRREGVETVAVCLLHSYANPAHEQALRLALAPHFPYVSISSEINAEFREYERTCTTVLNAAVMPLAARYVDDLVARLDATTGAVPLHLLHSAGGMMSVGAARARPLTMAMSGPAAGVAAAAHTARALGLDRGRALALGGTPRAGEARRVPGPAPHAGRRVDRRGRRLDRPRRARDRRAQGGAAERGRG